MQTLLQDLRYGARMLVKNPGFTLITVLTLALGIGANTAIFTIVNAVLLRPLPYSEPERLVFIYDSAPGFGIQKFGLIEAEFLRLRDQAKSFERLSLYSSTTLTVTGAGEPERISAGMASGDFFATLGAPPALGRSFKREEEPRGQGDVVILSYNFWRRKFSADPAAIGRSLTINERSHTIVGVLPQGFKSPIELQSEKAIELWTPPGYFPANPCCSHWLNVVGRLRAGSTIEQAQAETGSIMAGVMNDFRGAYPKDGSSKTLVKPLGQEIVGDLRRSLWVLLTAVSFVLLIACANVANLLLSRSESRSTEIAIRTALGAGRARIIRQLMAESLLLAVIGGGLGLLLALWGVSLLPTLGVEMLPRLQEITLDARALGFTASISLLTAMVFGLAPAIQAVKFDVHTALKEGGRASGPSKGRSRFRNALVVAEVALSLVLLIGAGLLIKSFWRLQQVETGFRTEQLLTMRLYPSPSVYPDDRRAVAFYDNLLQRIRSLPGVQEAAVASGMPIGDGNSATGMETEGQLFELNTLNLAEWRVTSPEYFRTLGVKLLRGRLLEDSDQEQRTPVAVINETLARAHWPNEDPLGRRIRLLNSSPERATTAFLTIVGVVADTKNGTLTKAPGQEIYIPLRQRTAAVARMGLTQQMSLAVRASVEPPGLATSIRKEISALDPDVPITDVRTMEQVLETVTTQPRFNTILLGVFAALSMLLATVGVYGVLSYSVSQRSREIGVRLALGAQQGDVLKLIVRQGMILAFLGVTIGLAASFAVTRLIAGLLYNVSATDPLTFGSIAFLLTAAAFLACWIPARRAAKVDPMIALRAD